MRIVRETKKRVISENVNARRVNRARRDVSIQRRAAASALFLVDDCYCEQRRTTSNTSC